MNVENESPLYNKLKEQEVVPLKTLKLLRSTETMKQKEIKVKEQPFETDIMRRITKFSKGAGLGKFTEFINLVDSLVLKDNKGEEDFYGQIKNFAFHQESDAIMKESSEVKCVALSPNRVYIASGTQESLKLWDVKKKTLLANMQHLGDFEPISIALANNMVYAGGVTGLIKKLEIRLDAQGVASLHWSQDFKKHVGLVQALALKSDSQTLISGGDDGLLVIWDLISSMALREIKAHIGAILSLVFDGKETTCISAGEDKNIKIWDITTGLLKVSIPGLGDKILAVAMSPEGRFLATGSLDRTLRLYDMEKGEEHGAFSETAAIRALAFLPSSGLSTEVSLVFAMGPNLMIWDVIKNEVSSVKKGHTKVINSISLSLDGTKIISGSNDRTIRIWSLKKAKDRSMLWTEGMKGVIAIRATNEFVFTGGEDRLIRVWSLKTCKLLQKELQGHKADITSIAISPDQRGFASGDKEGTVCFWKVESQSFVRGARFPAQQDAITDLKFIRKGNQLVTLGKDCLRLWNCEWEKNRPLKQLELAEIENGNTMSMDLDAAEENVIIGNAKGQLICYKLKEGFEENFQMKAHSYKVTSVKFTLFGGKLISASTDHSLKIWELKTLAIIYDIGFPKTNYVLSLELTSDNSRIITSCEDQSIRIWEIETGKQVGISEDNEEKSAVISLTPDQSKLVISGGGIDNRMNIMNLGLMKTMRVLRDHCEKVRCLAISNDDRMLASGSNDFSIKVWDLTTLKPKPLDTLVGHALNVTCLKWMPDNKRLISGSKDNTIRLWEPTWVKDKDKEKIKFIEIYVLKKASNAITDIHFFQDEDILLGIFSIKDKTLRVWDFENSDFIYSFPPAPSNIRCMAVWKNQKIFGGTKHNICVYDIQDQVALPMLQGHDYPIKALVVSDASNKLFSGSQDSFIKVWNTEDGSLITTLRGHSLGIKSLEVNDEGSNLFSGSKDKTICMWDIQNYKKLSCFEGHTGPVQALCLTSDQKTLYSCSNDNNIRAWDLDDSSRFPFLEGHSQIINDLVMTPDGTKLISAGCDNNVIIWNFETGKQREILRGQNEEITGLVLNFDSTQLLTYTNQNKNILIWVLETKETATYLLDTIENVSPSDCLAIAENDKFIVTGCSDSVLRVIDFESQRVIKEFEGHCGNVRSILITKDNETLISGGNDGFIIVWKYETLERLKTFKNIKLEGAVLALLLSEDSKTLYAGYSNGKTILWDMSTGEQFKTMFVNDFKSPIRYLSINSQHLLIGSQNDLQLVNLESNKVVKIEQITNKKMIVFPNPAKPEILNIISATKNEIEIREMIKLDDIKFSKKILGIPEQITAETITLEKDMLIFSSTDHTIYVWHLYQSERVAHFEGHKGEITALLVSKDNNRVFSASQDKKIGIWSIKNNALVTYLNGHSDSVLSLAFSPKETFMISGSDDGAIIMWDLLDIPNYKQIRKYRIDGEKILSLDVSSEDTVFLCGGASKIIYEFNCQDENKKPRKVLILDSEIKRLFLSPDRDNLVAFLGSSKMLITDTKKFTIIRELELKKDNFRTLPVFINSGKNPLMLYFEKLIDIKTGEVIFDFETIEEFYSFFYDARPGKEVYYYISTNFQLLHFKMNFFTDFLINYLNYDSLTNFADSDLICQRKQSVFPFFFTFMHLISIFEKQEYFTIKKLEEIYENDVKIEYFYTVDVFLNTPLDILLLKNNSTLIDKYFEMFFFYFSKDTTTFAQKARFLNYDFKPKYGALDLLKKLISLCEEDMTFIGNFLDNAFISLDPTVYNNTLSFMELDDPIIAESDNFQTNDSDFLEEELKKKLAKIDETKKKSVVKAKIICLPDIGNIFNDTTQDIFSHISDCDHDNDIFSNKTVAILAHHIWNSQIKFYYTVELCVFLFFFLLFNINMICIYQQRLGANTEESNKLPAVYTSKAIDVMIIVYGLFNFVNEFREFKNSGLAKYTKSIWNYFDVLLIPLLLCSGTLDFYLCLVPGADNKGVFKVIFAITNFCFWMRFISFFRAVAETSSMIRLIFTVISAVKYFILFMILFMGTLTATFFLLYSDDDPDTVPNILVTFFVFYRSTVGDTSGLQDYDLVYPNLQYLFMICSTFLFAIMLLNLLVSIIGDKHGEIQDAEEKTRLYELINILVDSNSSLITDIVKKIRKPRKVGTYLIYIYNNKHEEKQDDQFASLEENTQEKIDEMMKELKNFNQNLITEKNKQIMRTMNEMQQKIKMISDFVSKQGSSMKTSSFGMSRYKTFKESN